MLRIMGSVLVSSIAIGEQSPLAIEFGQFQRFGSGADEGRLDGSQTPEALCCFLLRFPNYREELSEEALGKAGNKEDY